MNWWAKQKGFTLVELLIVIVVIAILAAITIVAFNGIQERGRQAKIQADLGQIEKAIFAARIQSDKTVWAISSGSGVTADACGSMAAGTDFAALPKAHACWVKYLDTLDRITTAGGVDIRNIVDPWQRPYFIYENEGRTSPTDCTKDILGNFKNPHVQWDATNTRYVSNSLSNC